ncbi:MAG TPA: aminotransferase class V-fold PLP-dependent enzyme [Pyrinomonadaceae bacterium]|nr:aminotransferase class V-fold PLP-dependent enzyme [Pyrinomonadaceae bacterium]
MTDSHDKEAEAKQAARSSSLDISPDELRAISESATEIVEDYFARVASLPVFPDTDAEELSNLFTKKLSSEGEPVEKLMEDCRRIVEKSRHNGHPRFWGYVASPSTPVGAYADLIASALNQNVTSWRSAPAATMIERQVVRWLGSLIGYDENAHGLLTSGGSLANLNALYVAHRVKSSEEVSQFGLWNTGAPMTVYASDQVHFSIPKAADILGLGREHVRTIGSDERFKMDMRALRERVEADEREGFVPFCVVANAGTVNTGAIDPLADVGRFAKERGLWFHVDGAYGALGALAQTKRTLFRGMERADSVSLDPHKWLYAPVDCGCLLFRNAEKVRSAWTQHAADYIKVYEEKDEESFAFWDYGVELSRRFRALKIWLMLRYYGSRKVAEAISDDCAMAQYFAEQIEAAEDFELLAPTELSICCFRYVPVEFPAKLQAASDEERAALNGKLDELNARIMHAIQRGGLAYLSNATLLGRFALRACITNFRTTRADIDLTLKIIRDAAREVRKEQSETETF